jgi:6-phosphogluconate dehydrogenase
MVTRFGSMFEAGDVIIDGGNSNYKDSRRRGEELATSGIRFMDAGTSGGVWGPKFGYCLMVGSDPETFEIVEPALRALAPEGGLIHCGPVGSGHFTKMVHNGIEYGMMQAYAEGFDLIRAAQPDVDLHALARAWMNGSVIRSWLLELLGNALEDDPGLDELSAYVSDSGEGRWTVDAFVEHGIPGVSITGALFARFASRQENAFGLRILAALRNQFGGHAVRAARREPPVQAEPATPDDAATP